MKTISSIFFCCLLFISTGMFGQQTGSASGEIRKMEEQERTAVTTGDTATLFRLWSADYVVNNPNNMILTAAQIKAFIRHGGIDLPSFTRTIEKISFIKDMAVVMGSETVSAKEKAGKPVYRRYTNVWIKNERSWQLAARQVTTTLIQ